MELKDRRVLITGASRGIGAELARQFAGAGARVALVARSAEALLALADEVGGTAHAADLGDPAQVAGLIGRVEDDGGPVDVLVNNAGIDGMGYFPEMAPEELEQLLRVNLLSPMDLCRQVVPRMLARGSGHIVNVSSLSGVAAFPGLTAYSASKAGISNFTAGLRADLRGLPVGTTLVEMGKVVPTDMSSGVNDYTPVGLSFRRFERLGLLADVPVARLAAAVVTAVRGNRRHVRLPHRAGAFSALVELPRRATELLLTGVSHREKA
jgi:short-subunit dehydrogenase